MKVLDTKAKFHYGHNRSTTEGKQLYGGFSQYMYIEPGARLYKIPDGLPNDMACFTGGHVRSVHAGKGACGQQL